MPYQNKLQQGPQEANISLSPEEQFVPGHRSFVIPNSFMMAMPMTPPPGTPNSVMREMMDEQRDHAEAEEGRLSADSSFGLPNFLRRSRSLSSGASFRSGVFSSGMSGSSAFAGGHELVHTIRNTAAPAIVNRSTVFNTIQRQPGDGIETDTEDEDGKKKDKKPGQPPADPNATGSTTESDDEVDAAAAEVDEVDGEGSAGSSEAPKDDNTIESLVGDPSSPESPSLKGGAAPPPARETSVNPLDEKEDDDDDDDDGGLVHVPEDLPDNLDILTGNRLIRQNALTDEEIRSRSQTRTVSTTVTVNTRPKDGLVIHDSRKYDLQYVILGDGQYEVYIDGVWCRAAAAGTLQPPVSDPPDSDKVSDSDASDSSGSSTGSGSNPPPPPPPPPPGHLPPAPAPAPGARMGASPLDPNELKTRKLRNQLRPLEQLGQKMRSREFNLQRAKMLQQMPDRIAKIQKELSKKPDPERQQELTHIQNEYAELRNLDNFLDQMRDEIDQIKQQLDAPPQTDQERENILQAIQQLKDRVDQHRLVKLLTDLPDPAAVFGTEGKDKRHWYTRHTDLTDDQMNKIVEFYRAWCAMNGRDLGNNENDVAAPVRGGLASVVAAVPALGGGGADHAAQVHDGGGGGADHAAQVHDGGGGGADPAVPADADPAVPVLDGDGGGGEAEIAEPSEAAVEIPSSPPPESDSSESEAEVREELPKDTVSTERIGGTIQRAAAPAPPNGGRYHGSSFTSKFQRGLGIYNAVVSAGNLVNTRAKFGVMMDHYRHHHAGDNSTGPWDLRHSSGNYHQYTDWVAPIAGGSLNVLSGIGGLLGLGTGLRQTVRHVQNQKVGAHKADAAISSLDLISGVGKTASSIWSAVHNFSSIGKYAGLAKGAVGNATKAIPGLSIATGAFDTGVGAWQAIRAGRSWSKINGALQQIRQPAAPGGAAPAPAPRQAWNRQTDQQKLEDIFKHGRSTQKINTLSGSLKATQGLLTAAAGGATLGGALPVAAGFQGLAAITGIVKTAFERGLKRRLHKRVVAEDLNINWAREIDDVRTMMQMYNKNYNMRDKYVRQIILQAHGSDQKTFQEAYGKIKTKRANYLMSIARDQRNRYNQAAATVVEAMGVHKVNGAFVQGAEKLLAEKLG